MSQTQHDLVTRIMERPLAELEEDLGVELERSPETPLLGEASPVDSLALVALLLSIEQEVEEETGHAITLVDDRAMSMRNSPFRTLGTLTVHLSERLGELPAR